MALADEFAALFSSRTARAALRQVAPGRLRLPTFSLTTTSLRHMSEWLRRLENIDRGRIGQHGNYVSDPVAIGLVERGRRRPILTLAGQQLLAMSPEISSHPARSEYELLKILYYSHFGFSGRVRARLDEKEQHLRRTLSQFVPSLGRDLFLNHPSLLVVAELIAFAPGAVSKLCAWPNDSLVALAELTEEEFRSLGRGQTRELQRLCKKIAGEFRRAEDRRLHQIFSMLLLELQTQLTAEDQQQLVIPSPFNNLVQLTDLAVRSRDYTEDVNIWFDGNVWQISKRLDARAEEEGIVLHDVICGYVTPITQVPAGRSARSARHEDRQGRRGPARGTRVIVTDDAASERAEDYVELRMLGPRLGERLVRVGHRQGEVLALPDGLVPGADFYEIGDADMPEEFFEVKVFDGTLPTNVSLTRGECARALKCHMEGTAYTLLLVHLASGKVVEVKDIGVQLSQMQLTELVQFTIRVSAVAA